MKKKKVDTEIYLILLRSSLGFPGGSVVKNPPANAGDTRDAGSIPGLGRSLGERHGNWLQYFFPGESNGKRSVAGYNPWSHRELDMTEPAHTHTTKKLSILKYSLGPNLRPLHSTHGL